METQLLSAAEQIIAIVANLVNLGWAVPLVVIVVAVLKQLPYINQVKSSVIQFVVQVVVWVAYVLVSNAGYGDAFQHWTVELAEVMQVILPFVASLFGAEWLYSKAKQNAVPLLGARRVEAPEEPDLSMASIAK